MEKAGKYVGRWTVRQWRQQQLLDVAVSQRSSACPLEYKLLVREK
jgi:hypothetical protein